MTDTDCTAQTRLPRRSSWSRKFPSQRFFASSLAKSIATLQIIAFAAFLVAGVAFASVSAAAQDENLFGDKFPNLDSQATGQWWDSQLPPARRIVDMDVPREQVVAFALYTYYAGTLKMTAQLFPLLPNEPRSAQLQLANDSGWETVGESAIEYPGWDAHFRIDDWDAKREVRYRVVHNNRSTFEGLIRRDPQDKPEIKVAVLSCNSSRTKGPREEMIDNLKAQDPDLLFFAGDQTYHHTEHTAGWLEWGLQFRDVIGDRPTITIPDDHDVGQANLWGENGKVAATPQGPGGGYFYPPAYVNMVQRQQTWHLPDPVDPQPIGGEITVYFTRLVLGGIDFAILEDRKFKSGAEGKIPKLGPRPDHIVDPAYDRQAIDLPELVLLGDRQHAFLSRWSQDWTGAEMKSVLSQTAFCGAVHLHGKPDNRLLADLDCNGWPQSGRNTALRLVRQAWATHLCGDQHLAVAVKHGIDNYGDGPYAFTVPAIVNTIYGRWWHPEDEQPGDNAVPGSPLPWTGNYEDGLGNKLTMLAYANPDNVQDETERGDGYGLVRFNKNTQEVTFECWPRFAKVSDGDQAQYPGWPITVDNADNDGRQAVGYLPPVELGDVERPVVQVIDQSTSEILYTIRVQHKDYRLPVYQLGPHTIRAGANQPDETYQAGVMPVATP